MTRVLISSLLPTQGAIGLHQVTAKANKLRKMKHKEQKRYLAARPVPVVLDRDRRTYLIDRHHLCAACQRSEIHKVYIIVVADFSDSKSDGEFWTRMRKAHYTLLHGARGENITPENLPLSIHELPDDPYRSLAGLVRRMKAIQKVDIPFSEFMWADFFRKHLEINVVKDMLRHANVASAVDIACSDLARNIPGYIGRRDGQ